MWMLHRAALRHSPDDLLPWLRALHGRSSLALYRLKLGCPVFLFSFWLAVGLGSVGEKPVRPGRACKL